MNVVHLLASPFVGGPERQALGLAEALLPEWRTTFLSFAERGLARPFLAQARATGFEAIELKSNAPWLFHCAAEVAAHLSRVRADVLLCSGYKPDLAGWLAGRRLGIPVLGIAHGWTGATWKVRLNERVDRWVMRRLTRVVAVSEAMARRVGAAGVPRERVETIRNAVQTGPYDVVDPGARSEMQGWFAQPPQRIVAAAGRLSPEKGFDVLVAAAALVRQQVADAGFVLFGDGPLRRNLEAQVAAAGLADRFVFAGFRQDVSRLLPAADLAVLSSRTEGLPVVVLEAMAARLPVVATAVGGTVEVVTDGVTGFLVPSENPEALAQRMVAVLREGPAFRKDMGSAGRQRVDADFTFASQASAYRRLFARLPASPAPPGARFAQAAQASILSGRGS
jgi:glycosyltransferase involved in cell wall biosynthesis